MTRPSNQSAIDLASARLRTIALDTAEDSLLGSEEQLQSRLGVSRATVRQAARLLEREGLLRVKRGLNGGYFSARPSLTTIEAAVSTYLEVLKVDPGDLSRIASALWIEVVIKAAANPSPALSGLIARYQEIAADIDPHARFRDIMLIEKEFRTELFALTGSGYIGLIFQINMSFAERHFPEAPSGRDQTNEHRAFVQEWRAAKLMELAAIRDSDTALAALAARHARNVWERRVWYGEDNGVSSPAV
jgi:GntR family transcriptional repressor for pyruvate dehydrogenase complex